MDVLAATSPSEIMIGLKGLIREVGALDLPGAMVVRIRRVVILAVVVPGGTATTMNGLRSISRLRPGVGAVIRHVSSKGA